MRVFDKDKKIFRILELRIFISTFKNYQYIMKEEETSRATFLEHQPIDILRPKWTGDKEVSRVIPAAAEPRKQLLRAVSSSAPLTSFLPDLVVPIHPIDNKSTNTRGNHTTQFDFMPNTIANIAARKQFFITGCNE